MPIANHSLGDKSAGDAVGGAQAPSPYNKVTFDPLDRLIIVALLPASLIPYSLYIGARGATVLQGVPRG